MQNSLSTQCLDRLLTKWNNTVYRMKYFILTAGRYRATSILVRVHGVIFNSCQIYAMIYMLDGIVLERMMNALDIEFEKSLRDEGYESDNNYWNPPQVMRTVHIYLVFTTKASFYLGEYKVTPCTISPFMPRHPEACHSMKGSADT